MDKDCAHRTTSKCISPAENILSIFDLEYAEGKSFTEAHEMTSEIEQQIQSALQSIGKVTIHMEEYHPSERILVNVTDAEMNLSKEIKK